MNNTPGTHRPLDYATAQNVSDVPGKAALPGAADALRGSKTSPTPPRPRRPVVAFARMAGFGLRQRFRVMRPHIAFHQGSLQKGIY